MANPLLRRPEGADGTYYQDEFKAGLPDGQPTELLLQHMRQQGG